MDTIEAILARRSIRSFTPTPIAKEIVLKILEVATHCPSSSNGQPWEIFVASGTALERLRQSYLDRFEKNLPPKAEVTGTRRDQLPATILERMTQLRAERLKFEGVNPEDREAMTANAQRSARFFGAPVLVILCMNRALSMFSAFDLGLLTQNILLAAQNFGIGSLIAGSTVSHPDILRQEMAIPDDLVIVEGIVLGYPDKQSIINTYRSPRRPIQEVVTFREL